MSEEKDGLKSIKVYKFNNTKESWHGIVTLPDEKEDLDILDKDDAAVKKFKKEKKLARAANKKRV